MPRSIALLRAINVGGHTVRMERLRALFREMGMEEVETVIASGNVAFRTLEEDGAALEGRIERHLAAALGYEVVTFVRRAAEMPAIAAYQPHPDADAAGARMVAFLKAEPPEEARRRVAALATERDRFAFRGRELYWTSGPRISDSPVTGALLERALGGPLTMRNLNTVRRLAERFGGP